MTTAVVVLFGIYIVYVLIPVGKTSIKIHLANVLSAGGNFVEAQAMLGMATADDRFDPDPVAINGSLKLHHYQTQEQKDKKLLIQAESCLLEAISRNRANFKHFEKLAEVYSQFGQVSSSQENKNWLQKEFDSIRQATLRYPNSGRLRLKLANTAEALGKYDMAAENYARTIEIEDSYQQIYRIMYPGKEMFSRLGREKYEYAKKRLASLKRTKQTE